jgi:hypothetical protein
MNHIDALMHFTATFQHNSYFTFLHKHLTNNVHTTFQNKISDNSFIKLNGCDLKYYIHVIKSQAQLDTTGKYKTRCKALREEALSPLFFLLSIISRFVQIFCMHYRKTSIEVPSHQNLMRRTHI